MHEIRNISNNIEECEKRMRNRLIFIFHVEGVMVYLAICYLNEKKFTFFKVASMAASVKPEPMDEAEVEQMEPEAEAETEADADAEAEAETDSPTAEMDGVPEESVKTEEADDADEADKTGKKQPVLCTMEQLTDLAKRLGVYWKLLAPKLGFRPDEVIFFSIFNFFYCFQRKFYIFSFIFWSTHLLFSKS